MKVSIIEIKKDLYEIKSIIDKFDSSLDDTEKLVLHKQVEMLYLIKDDLEISSECIIEII